MRIRISALTALTLGLALASPRAGPARRLWGFGARVLPRKNSRNRRREQGMTHSWIDAISRFRLSGHRLCLMVLIGGVAVGTSQVADQAGQTYSGDGSLGRRDGISTTSLYVAFLSFHRPVTRETPLKVSAQAQRLGVRPAEVTLIDHAARRFVASDALLSKEARQYFEGVRAAGKPVDPAVAKAFSDRQATLAQTAFRTLEENLSPESYAGLRDYLKRDFSQTLTLMNSGHSTR